jgi:hypothetical protein
VSSNRLSLPRHQTLRATLDWSYSLLSEAERQLLERLSVFAGGCALEAAEMVCAGDGVEAADVLDRLTSLVSKSILIADRHQGQPARYHMLEMVKQYAAEKLAAAGDTETYRARHRNYFSALAVERRPTLVGLQWETSLRADQENFRQALEAAFVHDANPDIGPRLLFALMDHGLLYEMEIWDWSRRATAWLAQHPNIAAPLRVAIDRLTANRLADTDLPGSVAALRQVVAAGRCLAPEYQGVLLMSLIDFGRRLTGLGSLEEARATNSEAERLLGALAGKH